MTRPSTPPILSELRSPSSPATQIAALRALKNEIIGHEQKKETWVGLGVVTPLARILNTHKASGKRKYKDINGPADQSYQPRGRTEEEEARLQALIIVGSLAQGGPAYLSPLEAGSVYRPILAILNPTESHPQLILAALRTLNSIADSLLLELQGTSYAESSFLQQLYMDQHLASLLAILDQSSPALIVQQQISLAAALITKSCREEFQRVALAQAGLLEALAYKLASFVIITEHALFNTPGEAAVPVSGISPATTKSQLSPILQAIGTIISKSKVRTKQFISSPVFAEVFPGAELNYEHSPTSQNGYGGNTYFVSPFAHSGTNSPRRESSLANSGFPPLGAFSVAAANNRGSRNYNSAVENIPHEHLYGFGSSESPLVTWLVHVVRAETGVTRLMAAWILTILHCMGFANHRKEVAPTPVMVPLLVCMLDKDFRVDPLMDSYDDSLLQTPDWLIKEHAPAVLSMLVEDQLQLQQAAVDAGAIKMLSRLLRQSYDPLPNNSKPSLWTPNPLGSNDITAQETLSASRLGAPGLSVLAYHVLRMRESVLIALAALATAKDDYRKAIIDNGVVSFVIESLNPHNKSPPTQAEVSALSSIGNPIPVLLAACAAARALSRSVNTLRTSLIDAGLATPLFVLLKHSDVEVQIASTAVVCNLLLEFSPMRETMIEKGILEILCEHAHSINAKLRLNAIWGLKHLVNTASNELKVKCLEELGPGWLKQIISNDHEDTLFGSSLRGERDLDHSLPLSMGTPNAAGEQVDLLNAIDEQSAESTQADEEDEEDEVHMIDSIGPLSKQESHSTKYHISLLNSDNRRNPAGERRGMRHYADAESQADVQTRKDDIAVQEQALKLIQNLICGPNSDHMIDHVFREFGQEKFFDILATRLLPKFPDLYGRDRKSSDRILKQTPPPTEIVKAVCYIVVHIAAGSAKHRQQLMSQHELLRLLVPLYSHPSKEIRVTCAWLVINLTWADDSGDKHNCKLRAHELRKLGVYEKLEQMEHDDELDVRERTKTALHQMNELLRS